MKVDKTDIIIAKKRAVPIEVGQEVSETHTIEQIDVTENATYVTVTDSKVSRTYGAKVFLEKFKGH